MNEINFLKTLFWLRILGLPLGLFSKFNVLVVASKIGKIFDIEFAGNGHTWVDYLQVKISIRIDEHGLFLAKPSNSQNLVFFWLRLDHEMKCCNRG